MSEENYKKKGKRSELPEEKKLKKIPESCYFILALYASWEVKFLSSTVVANSGA